MIGRRTRPVRGGRGAGPASRSRVAILAAVAVLALLVAPAASAATPSPVVLADAIAPGRFTGQLGLGPGPVAVAPGAEVTYLVTVNPPLPGGSVEIWTQQAGAGWQPTRSARIAAGGTARTYLSVSAALSVQARISATATHGGAVSPGRHAGVDSGGRSVIPLSCPEVAALGRGAIAARSAGMTAGATLEIQVCATGGDWAVTDADLNGIAVHRPTSGSVTQRFDLRLLRPGTRSIRLREHAAGAAHSADRSLLVVLEAPPLAVQTTANIALTPPVPCGTHHTCVVRADVVAPRTRGPWPVVVFLRGGPGGLGARSGYAAFIDRLASTGVVVYNADYRDTPAFGAQWPRAFDDAACAVRVARATAARYGGAGSSVTLVGHSMGAYVGSVVALSADAFASSCLARGQGAPDTFVGISGPYRLAEPNLQGEFSEVLGGSPAQASGAWHSADPFAWVGRRPGVRFRLIHGSQDPTVDVAASVSLETALLNAGFDTSLTTVSGGSHVSVVGDAKGGEWALAVILAAIR